MYISGPGRHAGIVGAGLSGSWWQGGALIIARSASISL
jgi:hypothetical protein